MFSDNLSVEPLRQCIEDIVIGAFTVSLIATGVVVNLLPRPDIPLVVSSISISIPYIVRVFVNRTDAAIVIYI